MNTFNPLEESIIEFLRNKCEKRLNYRFTIDENNVLLAEETDEQAGIVDLTEDYACAFKTEPVYADSYEEIAEKFTAGSSKMYREMMVCGSQPYVTLLSLSTGTPSNDSGKAGLQRAIVEMASYGNTFGIPVTGGDLQFNEIGQKGICANLLTIGLIDKDRQFVSSCRGADNPVYLIGAPNLGKDTLSNALITRALYEMICDLHEDNAIVALKTIEYEDETSSIRQIISSSADMVATGTKGIELNTEMFARYLPQEIAEKFPEVEPNLAISLPVSMLMILREDCCKKLEQACRKWNIRCVQIGVVIDEHKLKKIIYEKTFVDLPASALSGFDDAMPENNIDIPPVAVEATSVEAPIPGEHKEVVKFMLTCPNLSSQQSVFGQFDSTVGTNNLSTNYVSDAAVFQIKGVRHALAVAFCQSATDIANYPESVNLVIAEALRKVVCSGGVPLALTGCLNYSGNIDEKILHAVNKHIALFCEKISIASSGINMNHAAVDDKPAVNNLSIGAIAIVDDKQLQMTISFKKKGDMIYMLGKSGNNINSSEYIRKYHNINNSPPQCFDLDLEVNLLNITKKLIARKFVNSAHSVSKGGLFMALLESALVRSCGFDITVEGEIRKDAFLFGESPSRIIVSVAPARETKFIDFMMEANVPFMTLGHVTREEIRIDDNSYGFISDYRKMYLGE